MRIIGYKFNDPTEEQLDYAHSIKNEMTSWPAKDRIKIVDNLIIIQKTIIIKNIIRINKMFIILDPQKTKWTRGNTNPCKMFLPFPEPQNYRKNNL